MVKNKRETQGHYEIDTGEGWEEISKHELSVLMFLWSRDPTDDRALLQEGARIYTGSAEYRYVEE